MTCYKECGNKTVFGTCNRTAPCIDSATIKADGTGRLRLQKCITCQGTGTINIGVGVGTGNTITTGFVCTNCNGLGYIYF